MKAMWAQLFDACCSSHCRCLLAVSLLPILPASIGLTLSYWCACLGGLATLVEKKSRRMELAIYCLSRALESFALCLAEWGLVRRSGAACHFLRVRGWQTLGTCVMHMV